MYFAKVDILNNVLKVIVADQDFIDQQPGQWVPCDISGVYPKNYPGPGYTYDPIKQQFVAPKPFYSWILDEETAQWEAPIPYPIDEFKYAWDEYVGNWVKINME